MTPSWLLFLVMSWSVMWSVSWSLNVSSINDLIDSVCVPVKFADARCDGNKLMKQINQQVFDFRSTEDLALYASWLRLMNNLEYYKSHDPEQVIDIIAYNNNRFALINYNITKLMKKEASEVFRWVSDTWARFHTTHNYYAFKQTLPSFRNFFNTFVLWCDEDPAYFLTTALYAFRRTRHSYQFTTHFKSIDDAAVELVVLANEYPLLGLEKDYIQRLFYINYVMHIKDVVQRQRFKPLYIAMSPDNILRKTVTFQEQMLSFHVHHNVENDTVVDAMQKETRYVFKTFVESFERVSVHYNFTPTDINVYVHDSKKLYTVYGPLWNIATDNGGYTHISPRTRNIESHVYFENDILPRNYGHELHHAILYSVTSVHSMPVWYVEGAANRYGNRDCYEFDHETLKMHQHTRIKEIVEASYTSSALVYGMGSALVAFLNEQQPTIFQTMANTNNYTLTITPMLEKEFDIYKQNKILECEMYLRNRTASMSSQLQSTSRINAYLQVQLDYKTAINNTNVFAECTNYIQINFEDVTFIMTPHKIIMANVYTNDSRSVSFAQHEIRFNRHKLSRFDYDWFLNGLIKQTLIYLGDVYNYIGIDNTAYNYRPETIFCQKQTQNPELGIIEFVSKTNVWSNFFNNMTVAEARQHIRNFVKSKEDCATFLNPVVVNDDIVANVPQYLKNYAYRINNVVTINILNKRDVYIKLDFRNNTILHLAALHNPNTYVQLSNQFPEECNSLLNYDNYTSNQLYQFYKNYKLSTGVVKVKYCFKYIKTQPSQNSLVPNIITTLLPAKTKFNLTTNTPKYINDDYENVTTSTDNFNENVTNSTDQPVIIRPIAKPIISSVQLLSTFTLAILTTYNYVAENENNKSNNNNNNQNYKTRYVPVKLESDRLVPVKLESDQKVFGNDENEEETVYLNDNTTAPWTKEAIAAAAAAAVAPSNISYINVNKNDMYFVLAGFFIVLILFNITYTTITLVIYAKCCAIKKTTHINKKTKHKFNKAKFYSNNSIEEKSDTEAKLHMFE